MDPVGRSSAGIRETDCHRRHCSLRAPLSNQAYAKESALGMDMWRYTVSMWLHISRSCSSLYSLPRELRLPLLEAARRQLERQEGISRQPSHGLVDLGISSGDSLALARGETK